MADPRGRRRAGRAHADPARRTPAGRTPRSRPSGSAPTCASSRRCCAERGLDGVPYGHFGDGCVHVRIDFQLEDAEGGGRVPARSSRTPPTWSAGTAARSPASTATAGPAASCSTAMYSRRGDRAVRRRSRTCSTPTTCSTPVCWSTPAGGRRRAAGRRRPTGAPALVHDGGDFAEAVHRCTGVGKCRADNTGDRRRDVPVLPRHPRARRTPPEGGPGCCRTWSTGADRRWTPRRA